MPAASSTRTLRGWNKYGIAPAGGERVFHTSLEYRYRGFALFLDSGTVWDTGVDNSPASFPVTYSVGGRQYVAVATNEGFVHTQAMAQVQKLRMPANGGATLWVFALPDKAPQGAR